MRKLIYSGLQALQNHFCFNHLYSITKLYEKHDCYGFTNFYTNLLVSAGYAQINLFRVTGLQNHCCFKRLYPIVKLYEKHDCHGFTNFCTNFFIDAGYVQINLFMVKLCKMIAVSTTYIQ